MEKPQFHISIYCEATKQDCYYKKKKLSALPYFLLWAVNLFFDLAKIFSNEWITLILTSNSLIDGSNLFCLQQYKYSFAASKIWFANSLCSHVGAKNDIFLWEMSNLGFTKFKTLYYLSSKKFKNFIDNFVQIEVTT